jgi:two-component system cell cycle sensor histidine kinase/response regulator CckA
LGALADHQELALFNFHGQTLYTTHPYAYPNRSEFIRRLVMRLAPGSEAATLKSWIEEFQHGQILVSSGGNGLGGQQRWWLATTLPVEDPADRANQLLLVSVVELTDYLENHHQLQHHYTQLEAFIDNAPFGVFYANPTGHFVGLNSTLGRWLGQGRERLLGQPVGDLLDGFDPTRTQACFVTLKPFRQQPFKAIWFPAQPQSGMVQASIICRVDRESMGATAGGGGDFNVFDSALIPSLMVDHQGKILSLNPAFTQLLSYEGGGTQPRVGCSLFDLIENAAQDDVRTKISTVTQRASAIPPFEFHFKGGIAHTTAYMSPLGTALRGDSQAPVMIQFIDISEQKRLEEQFIQSQKMQAVGQLAGGIAHDFNNLLTAMIGFCDLLLQRYMPSDTAYMDVMQIKQNANRAANLVRQLLAFSRQQTLQPRVTHITDILAELSALLRRLIGATITLNMSHGRDLWPVKVDPGQLEQVIINLAVNARDAMTNGGTLGIRTENITLEKPTPLGHDVMLPGDYILIEVSDSGHGIAPEHRERIFEPFFSTKEVGQGTGLGLSTVFGIVKQTGGFVGVDSQLNEGTVFNIYLPRYVGDVQAPSHVHDKAPADLTGHETVLLVEDEDAVRLFSARALREKGYNVLEAESGEAALNLVQEGQTFHILVTDVVMPKMDGPTLSKKVRELLPQCKIIFISGYAEDTFRKNLDHDANIHFLPKPFTLKDLATKVRDVLGAR